MTFQERIDKLNKMIAGAQRIVFFTGAGISTSSGIPDFRSANGLYSTSAEKDPEYMLSSDCLQEEPERFFKYLRDYMDFRGYEPNIAHKKISELQLTKTVSVITQNIDGLHEKAGSEVVDNIHGTMNRWYCVGCFHDLYTPEEVLDGNYDNLYKVPKCPLCGGEYAIRPDITLYGEGLPSLAWADAAMHAGAADLFIVVGTSLTVSPANYLPYCFSDNKNLVIINRDPTSMDYMAGLVFHEDIADVFAKIVVPE
jgi:NAD-dependent deacetylase